MNTKGYTLVELMITVLLIGILAAISIPQYTKLLEKQRATEAIQALLAIAKAQQRYFVIQDSYAKINYSGNSLTTALDIDNDSIKLKDFTFSCGDNDCNKIIATRSNIGTDADSAYRIGINNNDESMCCSDAPNNKVCSSLNIETAC
jgi:prepilin-type N-terminal cleavage/methylation domain-containing protein